MTNTAIPANIIGRLPAHNLDAEAAVLSAILLKPDALGEVEAWLMPWHFYSDANARIYESMLALSADQRRIDVVTVADYLRDKGRLQQIGGPAYLGQIADATPAIANIAEHAAIVVEKAKVRGIVAQAQRIAAEGYGDVGDPDAWASGAVSALAAIAEDGAGESHLADGVELADGLLNKYMNPGQGPQPLRTGIPDLDRITRGLRGGQLVIIGPTAASARARSR